jgi:hypothetical protein
VLRVSVPRTNLTWPRSSTRCPPSWAKDASEEAQWLHVEIVRRFGTFEHADGHSAVVGRRFNVELTGSCGGQECPWGSATADLITELRQRQLPFLCCTNASGKVPADYAASLRAMGLPIADEELITPAVVAAEHLAAAMPEARVIVIGGDGVVAPIRDRGITVLPPEPGTHADAVLVGPAPQLSASALQVAAEAVRDGAAFFVTSYVPLIPEGSGNVPSVSAAFGAAIAHVAGTLQRCLGNRRPSSWNRCAGGCDSRPERS